MIAEATKLLILQFGASAVALALVAWLAREIAKHWLSKEVGKFEAKLQSDLRREEFVFQQVRERRTLVVAELYSLLRRALNATRDYVMKADDYPDEGEREIAIQHTANVVREARDFFEENRIWLPEEVDGRVDELFTDGEKLFYRFVNVAQTLRTGLGKGWAGDDMTQLLDNAYKQVPKALSELQVLFRTTLGPGLDQ